MKNNTEKLLTKRDLADFLGISVGTVDRWTSLGVGGPSFVRVGGVVRYTREDILAYLDARKNQPRLSQAVV